MTPQTTERNDARPNGPDKPKRDFRQEVTDQIVQMLEKGVAPWQKPWEKGPFGMPFNPTTQNPYRGGNAIHRRSSLSARSEQCGWAGDVGAPRGPHP